MIFLTFCLSISFPPLASPFTLDYRHPVSICDGRRSRDRDPVERVRAALSQASPVDSVMQAVQPQGKRQGRLAVHDCYPLLQLTLTPEPPSSTSERRVDSTFGTTRQRPPPDLDRDAHRGAERPVVGPRQLPLDLGPPRTRPKLGRIWSSPS